MLLSLQSGGSELGICVALTGLILGRLEIWFEIVVKGKSWDVISFPHFMFD